MKKNEAINIINQQNNTHDFTSRNTHFANLTDYHGIQGWWLNIPFHKFSKDIYILLNDDNEKELTLISLPSNSITEPEKVFRNKGNEADIFIKKPTINDNKYLDNQSNGTNYQFTNIQQYSYTKKGKKRYNEEELTYFSEQVFKIYIDKYMKNQPLQYSIMQPSSNKKIIHDILNTLGMSIGTGENYSERLFNLWNELNNYNIHNGLTKCPPLLEKAGLKVFDKSKFIKTNLINSSSFDRDFEENIIKSKKSSHEDRIKRIQDSSSKPQIIEVVTKQFKRNADVVVEVLERAKGICERCKRAAPFTRAKDGTPYLEVHHKRMLSDGGDDTVENAIAVCPNCHRELHFG